MSGSTRVVPSPAQTCAGTVGKPRAIGALAAATVPIAGPAVGCMSTGVGKGDHASRTIGIPVAAVVIAFVLVGLNVHVAAVVAATLPALSGD